MSTSVILEGDLSDRLLPAILGEALRRRLTGRLILESDGRPVLELEVGGGHAASAAGAPEPAVVQAAHLRRGRFRLETGDGPAKGGVPLPRLILAAARATPDIERVQATLGGLAVPLCLTKLGQSGGAAFGVNAEEAFLLTRIDGHSDVAAICQMSPLGEDDTIRALYGLIAAGLVRLGAQPVAAPRAVKDPLAKLDGFLRKTAPPAAAGNPAAGTPQPAPGSGAVAPRPAAAVPPPSRTAPPAPAAPPVPRTAEHDKLEQRLRVAENQDHYQILGLQEEASTAEIRKTYFLLARQFHPDHFHRETVRDLQPQLERLFARMTEAYQTLTDDDARVEYDRARRGNQPDDRAKQEQAAREVARDNYRAGQHLLRKGQFVKALPYLENAVKADGSSATYLEALGAVQSLNPRHKAEAETHLKQAIELNRSGASAYLKLGLHYARCGRTDEARALLKQALSWDSQCEPARMLLPGLDGPAKAIAEGATQVLKELLQGAGAGAAG